jgi:hypothetical protein
VLSACRRGLLALTVLSALAACRGGARAGNADDAAVPARRVAVAGVTFDQDGLSQPLRLLVPERTRSIAVVAEGAPGALYALARLETADGVDQVRLPDGTDVGAAMRRAYFDERSGEMPGALRQSIRLGLFTQIFPDRPGVELPAGELALRIATTDPTHPVRVEVLLPEDTGDASAVLPINLFMVSRTGDPARTSDPESLPFLARLRSILAGGGVELRVERVMALAGGELSTMTEISRPQEPPDSASSRLALLGGALADGDALNVFIIDSLPFGVGGWTLGTPGPPLPDTYYSGVVAARLDGSDELARVLAHELCHYLGLWHVEHSIRPGATHRDPLDDTEPETGNLMDQAGTGTRLTADQSHVLARHPILRRMD